MAIELERQAVTQPAVRLIFAGNRSAVADAVRRRSWGVAGRALVTHVARRARQRLLAVAPVIRDAETVILLHPQTIGGRWCLDLIRRRCRPTWIYLLDSSFFCIRSYNHVPPENDACIRCLEGVWSAAGEQGCHAYPAGHDCGMPFLEQLRSLAASGRVRFMAQNPRQAMLAEHHFGARWPVPVVGMWTVDLAEVFAAQGSKRSTSRRPPPCDVVFHGGDHAAKGFFWTLELARRLPTVRFMFPLAWRQRSSWGARPANCEFVPMTWESGLEEAVAAAPITLVPSLWSAPVEGALVKSIMVGRAVAAPAVGSGYVSDLPDGLVWLLDRQPARAADQLAGLLAARWRPAPAVLNAWQAAFQSANAPLLATMLGATSETKILQS